MPIVDEALTRRVAELARLELTDDEVKTFSSQLGQILAHVEELQKVDVSGVEPMTHPLELETPLREDRVVPSPMDERGRPKSLGSAPEVEEDGFKVPPVLG